MGSNVTEVGPQAGTTNVPVFANLGIYKYLGTNANWCRILGTPGEYTVDSVKVEFDALPDGIDQREAVISVTDSIQTLDLIVRQDRSISTPIQMISTTNNPVTIEHFDLQGRRINAMRQPRGVIIERRNGQVRKVMGKQ